MTQIVVYYTFRRLAKMPIALPVQLPQRSRAAQPKSVGTRPQAKKFN